VAVAEQIAQDRERPGRCGLRGFEIELALPSPVPARIPLRSERDG